MTRQIQASIDSDNTLETSDCPAQMLVAGGVDYAIYSLDLDGNVQSWNARAQRIKGYSAQEIIGSNFSVFYTADDVRAEVPARSLEIARSTGRFEADGWHVRKDGTRLWSNVVIDALQNPAGEVVGFAKITRDLTQTTALCRAGAESAEIAQMLVDSVVDYAIYLLDLEGTVKSWNAGARRIKGYSAQEIVGSNFSVFYTNDDVRAGEPARSLEIARTTGRFEAEGWRVRKDGTRLRASVVIDAVRNPAGEIVGFAKITRDVTDSAALRHVTEQLRAENAQLLVVNKSAKDATRNGRKHSKAVRSSIGAKFAFLGVSLCASFAIALYLCANTYAPIAARSHDEAQANTVAMAAAGAFEQWTLEDDALDMYVALIALRDPAQRRLASTTVAHAIDASKAIEPELDSIQRIAADSESLTLLARIRRDLTTYDAYTARMRLLAKSGDVLGAVHIQSVDNGSVSDDVTDAFRALQKRWRERAHKANDDVNRIAAFGARPMVPIAALILVLTVFVLTVVGRSITEPLRRLTVVAQRMAVGDVDVEADLPRSGSDEVGTLSGSFREMLLKRRQVEEQLVFAAFHDELTGLANRALLMDRLHRVVAKRYAAAQLWAILFLDLDRFKVINDSLGHGAGDLVLIEAARRVERCLRSGDTLARLGGDEFIIFLDDIADVPAACTVARRVLRAFESAFTVAGSDVFVSTSIGIATSQNSDDRPEDVLRNADIALYRAKELGKQRYELFGPELLERAVGQHEVENDLARALEREEFCLYYQPIMSLYDGGLSGFEALVRWRHPRRGLVNPDEFISLAEETGAIVAIGEWILREACRQLQSWRATFANAQDLRMNVNVSAKQLATPLFAQTVESALSASGLNPGRLNVEITESVLVTDANAARSTLVQLKRLGVHIHLDDFGTGYSSLGYLHNFPIDALKIDRSFVSDSKARASDSKVGLANIDIVRTIIALAQSLSLAVTAEGIETDEQREQLRALDCSHGQGYYFSRPVDASKASGLIAMYLDKGPVVRQEVVPAAARYPMAEQS